MNDSTVLHGEGTTKSKGESGVVAVVGVGSGLGAALARRFAAGYKVALIARTAAVTGPLADEIRAAGGIAVPIQSDATVEEQIAATHAQIRRELGPIEILIYNGGRRPMGRLLETTPEVFEQTWRLHTFGAFLWARQVVPEMLQRGSGSILIPGRPQASGRGLTPRPLRLPSLPCEVSHRYWPAISIRRGSMSPISMWTVVSTCRC